MKLVRLTTENSSAFFDATFNDGIEIKPDTKIALQSISAALGGGAIKITDANNGITYQIKNEVGTPGAGNGGERKITLLNKDYNSSNAQDLLKDIANQLNSDAYWSPPVGATPGFNKILGLEWDCTLEGGKVSIGYQIGLPTAGDFKSTGDLVTRTGTGQGASPYTFGLDGTEPARADFKGTTVSTRYLSKGNSYFRVKIGALTLGGATTIDETGFYIGLTKRRVDSDLFGLTNMNYAIRVAVDPGTGTPEYGIQKLDASGTPIGPSPVAVPVALTDTLQVGINGGNVVLWVWKDGDNTPTVIAEDFVYDNEELYPFLTFKGARANATVTTPRVTYSPNSPNPVGELGAPPNQRVIAKTDNFIQFDSSTLAEYLGYDSRRLPESGVLQAKEPAFIAQETFKSGIGVKGFIVQLLNISLDSYDSFKEQRENILAVIPSEDGDGNLVYTPAFPNFIDIMNKDKMTIRNIRARVVNTDYSALSMTGIGQMTFLIDN